MAFDRIAERMEVWGYYYPRLATRVQPTPDDLAALGATLGTELPEDYAAFLTRFGCCAPYGVALVMPIEDPDWRWGRIQIGLFYGFTSDGPDDVRRRRETYADRIPSNLLPIACALGDEQICLGLSGEERGKVYFWSHDHPRPAKARRLDEGPWTECIYSMAPSLTAFFDKITGKREEPDDRLPGEAPEAAALRRSQQVEALIAPEVARVRKIRELLEGFRLYTPPWRDSVGGDHDAACLLTALRDGNHPRLRDILSRLGGPTVAPDETRRMEATLRKWFEDERERTPAPTPPAAPPPPPPASAKPTRVRHRVFGEGVLVRELPGNKVEATFGDVTKILIRSVLEVLPD